MTDSERVRVAIVDDDPIVRDSLSAMLSRQPDLVIEFVASDGAQAIAEASLRCPDVVLMDIRMPGMDGITATARLRREQPAIKVLLMTSLDLEGDLPSAIGAGASGLILKTSPLKVLADQLRSVHHGSAVWTAEPFNRWSSQQSLARPTTSAGDQGLADPLTDRELEILRLLCQAQTNREIAVSLSLAESTVKTHVSAIMTKLGATTRLKAVIRANQLGL